VENLSPPRRYARERGLFNARRRAIDVRAEAGTRKPMTERTCCGGVLRWGSRAHRQPAALRAVTATAQSAFWRLAARTRVPHVIATGVDCRTHTRGGESSATSVQVRCVIGACRGRGLDAHRLWLSLSRCLAFWHGKRRHL
jgi:hypothetical protein